MKLSKKTLMTAIITLGVAACSVPAAASAAEITEISLNEVLTVNSVPAAEITNNDINEVITFNSVPVSPEATVIDLNKAGEPDFLAESLLTQTEVTIVTAEKTDVVVAAPRSRLGADRNRLEHTIAELKQENKSGDDIRNTDFTEVARRMAEEYLASLIKSATVKS